MAKVKVPKLAKPKGMKKLPGLGKAQGGEPLPDLDDGEERVASFVDDELARLTDTLGDEQLAKKCLHLKQKFPDASMLEIVMMEWFDRKHVKYVFQQWLLGGRILRGGQVTDFIVDLGGSAMVIEAQGNYWHSRPGSVQHDLEQKFALLGINIWGKKIEMVINVWESRIMQPNKAMREHTMNLAMMGIEVGK
jgi:hypothetical protein